MNISNQDLIRNLGNQKGAVKAIVMFIFILIDHEQKIYSK